MRQRLSRDQLRHVSSPSPLLEQTLNALIDATTARGIPHAGMTTTDQDGPVTRPFVKSLAPADWVQVAHSDDNVDPYCPVEVYDASFDYALNEFTVSVRKTTSDQAGLMLGTPEGYSLRSGYPGWIRLVNPYAPVRMVCNDGVVFGDKVAVKTAGDAFLSRSYNGYMRVVSGPRQSTTNHVLVLQDTLPLVGKTNEAVAQGHVGSVQIWDLPIGTNFSTMTDATLTGKSEAVKALFLFGGATGIDKWVSLVPHRFGLVAEQIRCPS